MNSNSPSIPVDLTKIETILGLTFINPRLLLQSLVHRSYLNENPSFQESNERLEFLGDSVLSLLASNYLYHLFPSSPEGKLTNLRSGLVRTQTLAEIATRLQLGSFLLLSRGEEKSGGRENPSLLADVFEALIGAIYLDQGLPAVNQLLEAHLFPLAAHIEEKKNIYDYKSHLQEVTQDKFKVSPHYSLVDQTGPDHDKNFIVRVSVNRKSLASGQGKSKQAAEQDAARLALASFSK